MPKYRKKEPTVKKAVVKLEKKVNAILKKDRLHEYSTFGDNNIGYWIGAIPNVTLDTIATAIPLTTLSQAIGEQSRLKESVMYESIKVKYLVKAPIGFQWEQTAGRMWVRVFVLKIKQMPKDENSLNYRHPTVEEVFATSNPIGQGDFLCSVKKPLVAEGKAGNYHLVYDRYHNIEIYGKGQAHMGFINIKVPKGTLTTFSGTSNTVSSCSQNHYMMYVTRDLNTNNSNPSVDVYCDQQFTV